MEEWWEIACLPREQLSAEELTEERYEELLRCAKAAEYAYAEVLAQLKEVAGQLAMLRQQLPVQFSSVFYPTPGGPMQPPGGRIPIHWKPRRFTLAYERPPIDDSDDGETGSRGMAGNASTGDGR